MVDKPERYPTAVIVAVGDSVIFPVALKLASAPIKAEPESVMVALPEPAATEIRVPVGERVIDALPLPETIKPPVAVGVKVIVAEPEPGSPLTAKASEESETRVALRDARPPAFCGICHATGCRAPEGFEESGSIPASDRNMFLAAPGKDVAGVLV